MWKIMQISESSPGKRRKSNSLKPYSGKDLPYIFKSNEAFSEQVRRCHYSQVCVGKRSLYIFPFTDLIAFKNSGSWLFWKETLKGWRCVSNIQGMLLLAKGCCRPTSGAMWEAERWHTGHQTEPGFSLSEYEHHACLDCHCGQFGGFLQGTGLQKAG